MQDITLDAQYLYTAIIFVPFLSYYVIKLNKEMN